MTLDQIAHALGGEVAGGQVLAPGPNHSPKDRSLAVKLGNNGGLIVFSHAGDDIQSCKDHVRAKLGLPPWNGNKSRLVQAYDYLDAEGTLLFQVCRFEPKNFRQRRPDGNGGWTWKLGDTPRVLYRLPELLEAVASERTVFIAEGEKAVDALAKLGVPATCSPMGAGKWRDEYSKHLAGADVVILPDNDAAGELHQAMVVKSLAGVAGRVRLLRLAGLPEGGDVYDWIEAGGDAQQLAQAVEHADEVNGPDAQPKGDEQPKATGWQAHVFTAAALRTMQFPEISYIVPGIIPEGLTILAGRPKIGKSWMALDIAIGVATGKPVLGSVHVEQGDVLYCCLEDNKRRLQRRVTKLLSPFSDEWPERLTLTTRWRRLDQGGVEDIEAWCNSVPEPRLVLLDTLAGVRPTRGNAESLYESDYRALLDVHRLSNERGIGAAALHHTRKMEADDPIDTISGSLGLPGVADTCLILAKTTQGTTLYIRGRDIEECERAIIFGSGNCKWTLLGDAAEVHRSDGRKKILDALAKATDLMTPGEIEAATGIKRNSVDQFLLQMKASGEVVQIKRGHYCHPDHAAKYAISPKNGKN